MTKVGPLKRLPSSPIFTKFSNKILLGVIFATFLLNFQPNLGYPPIKQNIAKAEVAQTQEVTAGSMPVQFQLPHPGYLSTQFSYYHPGIDVASGLGMPVKPIASGVVTEAGYNFWGLGLMVEIDHGFGYKSLYGHLGKIYVAKGKEIGSEDYLGEIGLTGHTSGPHTHLEITKEGQKINPLALLPQIRTYPTESDFAPIGGRTNSLVQPAKPAAKKVEPTPSPTPTPISLSLAKDNNAKTSAETCQVGALTLLSNCN